MHKRMFKVMTRVEFKNGTGGYWMRVGSGFENKDSSFNIHLEAMPKSFDLHIRELDEEDLRKREKYAPGSNGGSNVDGTRPIPERANGPTATPF